MPDLSVTIDGLTLPNPFVIGSGPPGTNANVISKAFDEGWGAVIAKTISLDASKVINVAPRYARTRVPGSNEVWGWENIELISDRPFSVWLKEFKQIKDKYPKGVLIASIMEEYNKDAWVEIVQRCDETGVDGYELNFSCPHGLPERRMGSAMGQDPEILEEVCGWVTGATRKPVWAKMTPNITHIVEPARAALRGGCSGISAINTILCVMGVNLETLRPEPTVEGYTTPGGYSCKAVRPIALRMVMECAQMIRKDFPGRSISGIGGVESGDDAAQFVLLGAGSVQVCTGVMIHGYKLIHDLNAGLSKFMEKHKFAHVADFCGASLPYFTTHADLVARQAAAKKADKARVAAGAAAGPGGDGVVKKDDNWSGDKFVEQSDKLVANKCDSDAMPLLIRNGRIITSIDDYVADIYCAGDTITRIEESIDPKALPREMEIIDAAGKYVFPGFIDPHVHIYLPFMGTYAKDDWETASKAALIGGTTTLIEMICPGKSDNPLAAYELWASKAEGVAACDYTYHMGVTRWDAAAEKQFREIVKRGITSFKVFLAYKGALGVSDEELYHALKLAQELGVIVTAHCENETLVAERQAELIAVGRGGPEWHEPSRPPIVEAEGVHHLMTFAELTGAAVYIVHTSCAEAVREADRARQRGVRAWIESVIPHFVLDKSYAEKPGFEGAKYVMSPPLREKRHQDFLWKALRARIISTVATDHAPFDFETQKTMGKPPKGDFTKIPNGIPSVENRVDLLYTHGVAAGRINLHTFVDCASTQAARLFGLKGKGTIAVGADADLVVYDPDHRWKIAAKTHHMATDYNAFEGWDMRGRASVVTVRGKVMARDGKFTGTLGHGRLLQRDAVH